MIILLSVYEYTLKNPPINNDFKAWDTYLPGLPINVVGTLKIIPENVFKANLKCEENHQISENKFQVWSLQGWLHGYSSAVTTPGWWGVGWDEVKVSFAHWCINGVEQ